MVRWHKPAGHIPSTINVSTKYGKSSLHGNEESDLVFKTWPWKYQSVDHENEVGVMCHKPGGHVPSMINVSTKNGKSSVHGNGETDLLFKTDHENTSQLTMKMRSMSGVHMEIEKLS
jgi:uncharacterized protein involved in tolerance to divalent cations